MSRTTLKIIKYTQIEQEDQIINITGSQHDPEEPTSNLIVGIALYARKPFIKFKTPHKGSMASRTIYDLSDHSKHPYWYQTGQIDLLGQGTVYFLKPMLKADEPLIKELFSEHS